MSKIRRKDVPRPVLDHLVDRVRDREITEDQIGLLAQWLATEPEVPEDLWFKRFPGMIACGKGELLKTFLRPGQVPVGEEIH